jgi:hypothetical protein
MLLATAGARCGEHGHVLDTFPARPIVKARQRSPNATSIPIAKFDSTPERQPCAVVAKAWGRCREWRDRMTDERRFEELLSEFTRVGVDLDSFPAGIGVHREDALRILRSLPDGAGPAAFLSRVRHEQQAIARPGSGELTATG